MGVPRFCLDGEFEMRNRPRLLFILLDIGDAQNVMDIGSLGMGLKEPERAGLRLGQICSCFLIREPIRLDFDRNRIGRDVRV